MLKAASGGGGRGIRRIDDATQMTGEIPIARAEALAALNDDSVYLEKVVINPKHVEVQILADNHGKTLHLRTRDCSIQRRNQKLIEIAPSMIKNTKLLDEICETTVKAAKAAHYLNAGTVEFLIDQDENYYFMEINTCVQVEHTVTEMITEIDIVRNQINIAFGKPLSLNQDDVNVRGHTIEVRINAEDPKNYFMPEGGKRSLFIVQLVVSVCDSTDLFIRGISYQKSMTRCLSN